MPTQRLRLTKTEGEEHRRRLTQLQKMRVSIACADDPSPEPNRFYLEPIQPDFARAYELGPAMSDGLSQVGVVVPAELTVLKPVMFIDQAMMLQGDDYSLELNDPERSSYYEYLIAGLPRLPPTVLNRWLTSESPVSPCKKEGVIIGIGMAHVPAKWHDETPVQVELSLCDDREHEFCFDFEVRMDRSLKRKFELRRRQRQDARLGRKRSGLYDCDQTRTTKDEGGSLPSGPQVGVSKYRI